jgi:hypothetical protein
VSKAGANLIRLPQRCDRKTGASIYQQILDLARDKHSRLLYAASETKENSFMMLVKLFCEMRKKEAKHF